MRFEIKDKIKYFPQRVQNSHKGTYGKIINISGSKFYSGAAILSSLAALKIGAGYVTLACPENICPIVAAYSPDITLLPLENTIGCISIKNVDFVLKNAEKFDVVSIGSGLSQNEETQKFVIEFLAKTNKACVIDADALNAVSKQTKFKLPEKSILTPHAAELSRLLNVTAEQIQTEREKYAIYAAKKFNSVVVLKGHQSIVTDGERIYINQSGNSALAKAGTGDVLTGIISGLTAQMHSSDLFLSSSLGVYLHGLTADIAVSDTTEYSLLASEILNYVPKAIECLLNSDK